MKILGIVLIVLGLVGLAYGGLSWTRKEKVVDIGTVEVTADTTAGPKSLIEKEPTTTSRTKSVAAIGVL